MTKTEIPISVFAHGVMRPLPDGRQVWSDILTAEEAATFLGFLGVKDIKKAKFTLDYYRREGRIKSVQMIGRTYYRIEDLKAFVETQAEKFH